MIAVIIAIIIFLLVLIAVSMGFGYMSGYEDAQKEPKPIKHLRLETYDKNGRLTRKGA